jgi:hypothetical protein
VERPRPRSNAAVWALGLVLAGGGAAALMSRRSPQQLPQAPAAMPAPVSVPTTVEVGVQVSPPSLPGLQMTIGGLAVAASAPHRVVPRAAEPVRVLVTAPGYRSADLSVVPDRDRSLVVTLNPVSVATTPPKPVPRAPAAAPTGVIRRYPF